MKKSSKDGAAKEKQIYELKSTVVSKGSKARGSSWEDSSVSASFEIPEPFSLVCLFLFLPSGEVTEGGAEYIRDESEM
jgi:hypothetical protein